MVLLYGFGGGGYGGVVCDVEGEELEGAGEVEGLEIGEGGGAFFGGARAEEDVVVWFGEELAG